MGRSMMVFAVAALMVAVAHAADDFEEPVPPTDAQAKKMKMKELKAWLSDRGLKCTDCFEKGDYTAMVIKNRDAKMLPSKRPRKINKDPLEKQWLVVVNELCDELKLEDKNRKPLLKRIESSFWEHTRSVSKQLHAEKHVMAKTSLSEPYILAMSKKLRQLIKWVKAEDVTKQDLIKKKFDNEIKMFLTHVAVKNVNPMHETLDGKDEL